MSFKKGEGGRPKGAKNLVTKEFRRVLEEHGHSSAEGFLDLRKNAYEDYKFAKKQLMSGRFSPMEDNCYKYMHNLIGIEEKMASYAHPKLKSVEQVKNLDENRPLKDLSDEELDNL